MSSGLSIGLRPVTLSAETATTPFMSLGMVYPPEARLSCPPSSDESPQRNYATYCFVHVFVDCELNKISPRHGIEAFGKSELALGVLTVAVKFEYWRGLI
jgi:hypothetical protein